VTAKTVRTDAPPRISWGLGDALAATVLAIAFGAVGGALILTAAGHDTSDEAPLWLLAFTQVPLWAGLLGVPWMASRWKGLGTFREDFGLEFRRADVLIGLGVGVAAQIALTALVPLYRLVGLDPDGVGESAERLADRATDPVGVLVLVLVTVVGAAVIEEVCYRGLWLRSLQRRFGDVPAILFCGVVFGAIHFQPLDFLPLAIFGGVLAALTVRHGRLGPAVFAHAAFNATAVVALVGGVG
jgi:uncharacterized protein